MSLKDTLSIQATAALRVARGNAAASLRVSALRSALAAVQTAEKAPGAKLVDGTLPDDAIVKLIRSQIKQRHESAEIYQKAGELRRSEVELQEADVLSEFVPQLLDEDATKALVERIIVESSLAGQGPRAIGQVMKALPDTADKAIASKHAKSLL